MVEPRRAPIDLSTAPAWAQTHEVVSRDLDCLAYQLPDIARIELRLVLATGQVIANIQPRRRLRLKTVDIPLACYSEEQAAEDFALALPEISKQAAAAGRILYSLGYGSVPKQAKTIWPNARLPNPTLGLGCSLIWDANHSDGSDREDSNSCDDVSACLLELADDAPNQAISCALAGIEFLSGPPRETIQGLLAELEASSIERQNPQGILPILESNGSNQNYPGKIRL